MKIAGPNVSKLHNNLMELMEIYFLLKNIQNFNNMMKWLNFSENGQFLVYSVIRMAHSNFMEFNTLKWYFCLGQYVLSV